MLEPGPPGSNTNRTVVDDHVTVFVYAKRKADADEWVRDEGLRPGRCHTFGTQSRWYGTTRFRPGDRIVILGDLEHRWEAVIAHARGKTDDAPQIERLPAPPPPPPDRRKVRDKVRAATGA